MLPQPRAIFPFNNALQSLDQSVVVIPNTQATARPRPRVFQGDPRLIMTPDGTRLQFVNGQPLMDRGLENAALISLFTHEGWCGNNFMKSPIGSRFVEACNQPITRSSLNQIRMAAGAALSDKSFGRVTVAVRNPNGMNLQVRILIEPPGGTPALLSLGRDGGSWTNQSENPAYPDIDPTLWRQRLRFESGETLTFENGTVMEF